MARTTIICDIDSTICDLEHRLHHITGEKKNYEAFYGAVSGDSPRAEIIDLMTTFALKGYPIVFMSGRPEKTGEDTVAWFRKHVSFPHQGFLFRKDNDLRPASEVKKDLFAKFFKLEDVLMAVDDDENVLNMWRTLGIPVVLDVGKRAPVGEPVVQSTHEETAPKVRKARA